jgi:hypothetical protein
MTGGMLLRFWVRTASDSIMTIFEGQVRNYTLIINTPRSPNKSQSVIALDMEAAGLAFLNFVPQSGTLGTNSKRVDSWPVFDLWYWIDAYPHVVDMLRNEKPVFFTFDDTIAAAILKTAWEPPGELEPPQPP